MSDNSENSKRNHPKTEPNPTVVDIYKKIQSISEHEVNTSRDYILSSNDTGIVEKGRPAQVLNFENEKEANINNAIVSVTTSCMIGDKQISNYASDKSCSGEARISFIVDQQQQQPQQTKTLSQSDASGKGNKSMHMLDGNRYDGPNVNSSASCNITLNDTSHAPGHEAVLQATSARVTATGRIGDCAIPKDSGLDCVARNNEFIRADDNIIGLTLEHRNQDQPTTCLDQGQRQEQDELESAFCRDHQKRGRPLEEDQNLKTTCLSPRHVKLNPGHSKRVRFKRVLESSPSHDVRLSHDEQQSLSPTTTTPPPPPPSPLSSSSSAAALTIKTNYSSDIEQLKLGNNSSSNSSIGGAQASLVSKQHCDRLIAKNVENIEIDLVGGHKSPLESHSKSNQLVKEHNDDDDYDDDDDEEEEEEDLQGTNECDDLLLNSNDRQTNKYTTSKRDNNYWRNRKPESSGAAACAPEAISISTSGDPRRVSFLRNLVDKLTYKRPASSDHEDEEAEDDEDESNQSEGEEQELYSRESLFSDYQDHSGNRGVNINNYKFTSKRRAKLLAGGRNFRGPYRYSRAEITMVITRKLLQTLSQRSTLSLIGAFLIHITLGTVYTLSNVSSYMISYMRTHGYPNATYGGSIWISSTYAIGQGFSIVLGGYLEKRFSARLASSLGCFIHSMSIMATAKSIDYGPSGVLLTYGLLPGIGCGLAYMTPMSNGFGWYPNRRGLVAGLILAGFGLGTFVFNMLQTVYVNPQNLSPLANDGGYFTQISVLEQVPSLFLFLGAIYAALQFIGCCLLFKPPSSSPTQSDERPIMQTSPDMAIKQAVLTREFLVLFVVYGITTQGVLFVNSSLKKYGQLFIHSDIYLAWTGSMASIANSLGRLVWGLAIDRYTFTQCFTCITTIFSLAMFLMPFEFVLSSKALYLICTLLIFGSFSGWMSTYPVHISRLFGCANSGVIYGLIFFSQSVGSVVSAIGIHYLVDNYRPFVVFDVVVASELAGLLVYHLFYPMLRDGKALEQN